MNEAFLFGIIAHGENMKYYAVKVGKNPGIYTTWEECSKEVLGFEGAIYKSFKTESEAMDFINDKIKEEVFARPYAYIDGSYDVKTGSYSFGCVLIENDSVKQFKKAYEPDEYSKHRNVAGEIKGAGFIIQYAINHGIKELDIYYDYLGIENWYNGIWKANEPIAKVYVEFANNVRNKIKVNFVKVKSHSNVYYNEMADMLAKEALNIA